MLIYDIYDIFSCFLEPLDDLPPPREYVAVCKLLDENAIDINDVVDDDDDVNQNQEKEKEKLSYRSKCDSICEIKSDDAGDNYVKSKLIGLGNTYPNLTGEPVEISVRNNNQTRR